MKYRDYLAKEEARDPAFKAAREALAPEFELRRALIAARIAAGMTQKALADKLNMRQPMIARLESGRGNPTLETLRAIADATGVTFVLTPHAGIAARAPRRRRTAPSRPKDSQAATPRAIAACTTERAKV